MEFDFSTLVTDRSDSDVVKLKALREKPFNKWTEDEIAWFSEPNKKGAYNYTDLNRVSAAMEALKVEFEGYGTEIIGYERVVVPHLESGFDPYTWYEQDATDLLLMDAYLANVRAFQTVLASLQTAPQIPGTMRQLTVNGANNIERVLFDAHTVLASIRAAWVYAGEIYSGE